MRRSTRAALLTGMLALCLASQSTGCAEERDAINHVQRNALPKSFFLGNDLKSPLDDPSFYARTTIVDVGFGANQQDLFVGNPSNLSIIKWEITETQLVGRLAYEQVEATDGKGVRPSIAGKNAGQPIFAFAITSHFDVRREYNPQTGEELNIIGENTTDRPWDEREYIRVDFSKNLIDSAYHFDVLSDLGLNGVKYDGLDFAVTDSGSIYAPTFDQPGGYFDVVNKVTATPETIDLSKVGWAQEYGIKAIAACDASQDRPDGKGPWASCAPAELTVRNSFRRVEQNDYEPIDQDGVRFSAYGAFSSERQGYDAAYGMTDQRWHRFVNRYDIWERSHYYADAAKMTGAITCNSQTSTPVGSDPNRDADKDGTADECAGVTEATGVGGSRCDVFTHKCTLPYQLRKQKPVVWYQTVDSTNDYFDGTQWAAHDWDVALRSAGQVAKYAECKSTGGTDCDQYAVYAGQQEENEDAIALARDVDDCRRGAAYAELGRDEAKCAALADEIGARRGLSAGVIALAKLPEAVVLCHSPVEAGDPSACGDAKSFDAQGNVTARWRLPEGITASECRDLFRVGATSEADQAKLATCRTSTVVRFGDLRYQQVMNVDGPQSQGPWGIMADANDPLTGRKVSSNITVYTYINRSASQLFVDQMRYVAGELATEDITEGTYVRDYAAAAQATGGLAGLTNDMVAHRTAAAAGLDVSRAADLPPLSGAQVDAALSAIGQVRGITADTRADSANAPVYEARRAAAVKNDVDAKLVTLESLRVAGGSAKSYANGMRGYVSQLQGANPTLRNRLDALRDEALEARGACQLEGDGLALAPYSLAAITEEIQLKFGKFDPKASPAEKLARATRIRGFIEQRIQYAVIAHEMGHSVGLRHNFVSSSDAFNYRPQYWQLRTRDGKVTSLCKDLAADGSTCVGPRYFDPVTKDEARNIQPMFMQSSVMEYPGEFAQDLIGLGSYDFAAARMFYGDAVGVYADKSAYGTGTAAGKVALNKLNDFGGLTGWRYSVDPNANASFHYSDLQSKAKLIGDCHEVNAADFKPASWDEAKLGTWSPLLDGLIVSVDGKTTRCRTAKLDFVPWTSLKTTTAVANGDRHGPALDPQGRIRVATGFASDNRADIGNASVFRHDNGADPYEQMSFLTTQAEMLHVFNDYRRGRSSFSVRSAATRWRKRTAEKIRDIGKSVALFFTLFPDERFALTQQLQSNVLAAGMAFDWLAREMARPESGGHLEDRDQIWRPTTGTGFLLAVPNGATGYFGDIAFGGGPLESHVADDKGDYDVEYTVNAGSYYKKMWVPALMTESVDKFVSESRSDFLDGRYRAVSLADIFPDGYRRWFGNMLTGDDAVRGVRVAADVSGRPLVEDGTKFPARALGTTSWWTDAPEVCFPKAGTTICSDLGSASLGDFPAGTAVLDPEVGWEIQRFMIAWTMSYLPENQKVDWLKQMDLFRLGVDADPKFASRIELHDPTGNVWVARTYGKESVLGKSVQKGIAARMLEYANDLVAAAYLTDPVSQNGTTWYVPKVDGNGVPLPRPDAKPGAAKALADYISVLEFMRQSVSGFGYGEPKERGLSW